MQILRSGSQCTPFQGGTLVPTMGALHAGHSSLIRRAAARGAPVIATVFVNPTQFGPGEDFDRYPRTFDADVALAEAAGADAMFAPAPEEIYPRGLETARHEAARITLPEVARTPALEDACRPGHFAGVCQVVARLFELTRPRAACFGEKDFQQLRLIEELAAHPEIALGCPGGIEIVRCPTVREHDGLAMSSRNRYLTEGQREQALGLYRALQSCMAAQRIATAELLMRGTLEEHGLEIEYATIRRAADLLPAADFHEPTRALIAARLGPVRLIDNMACPIWR
ncbi:MAG: pantoate--beta-alanine ligase [Phycisphaerales bacterium]|nr:pantoate--beta-alanine ligase [Phycisphaerales bacterium]